MTTGVACYDLATSPPTFNAMDFLLAAELWRLERGLDGLEVRVMPGPADGFRADPLPPFGARERRRWLENIVLPMPMLLPSCGRPAELVARDRRTAAPEFGRAEYRVGFRWNVAAARAGLYPFRADPKRAATWQRLFGRYVTITLRNPGWYPDRTSNLPAWRRVAGELQRQGLRAVFVPDGAVPAQAPIEGFTTVPTAGARVLARASLYEGAVLNLGLGCGPMWLAWFMGVPLIMFVKLNDHEPCAGAAAFRAGGLEPGEQLPNARPGQRLVWAADQTDTILAELAPALREAA